jgi:hypothetical protein
MTLVAKGRTAVMAQRREPPDALDYFPTPPWATRALFRQVLPSLGIERIESAWEPACGEGLMAEVMAEFASGQVIASDIFDYGYGHAPVDFLHDEPLARPAWVITNPPFNLACEFTLRALDLASEGVAMLARNTWIGRRLSTRHLSSECRWSRADGTQTRQPRRLTHGLSGSLAPRLGRRSGYHRAVAMRLRGRMIGRASRRGASRHPMRRCSIVLAGAPKRSPAKSGVSQGLAMIPAANNYWPRLSFRGLHFGFLSRVWYMLSRLRFDPRAGGRLEVPSAVSPAKAACGSMNRRELLLAILTAADGRPLTPVQLQKATFLVTENLEDIVDHGPGFKFVPYDYGPFDANVYNEAQSLALDDDVVIAPSGRGRWNTYAASEDGLEYGQELLDKLDDEDREYIVRTVKWVRSRTFSSLVKSIYDAYPRMRANSIFKG